MNYSKENQTEQSFNFRWSFSLVFIWSVLELIRIRLQKLVHFQRENEAGGEKVKIKWRCEMIS